MSELERIHAAENRISEIERTVASHGKDCDEERRETNLILFGDGDRRVGLIPRTMSLEEWVKDQKDQKLWLSRQVIAWWIVFGFTLAMAVFKVASLMGAPRGTP